MELIQSPETKLIREVSSYTIQCFQEAPQKTGEEKPLATIDAFDLFRLFTADIIRAKQKFTR